MAHAGQSIVNPVTGERVVFRSTAADSGGALLSMDYFAPAHHVIAPTHVHPRQEERSEVLAGRLHGHIGGDKRTVEVGEVAVVAPAVHHAWRSAGDGELHMLVDFRPALATETVLEVLWGLARAGRTNKRGMPSPLQMAVLMRDHLDETCAPVIPMVAQRALVGGMAAIGRRRGYRSVYPELLG